MKADIVRVKDLNFWHCKERNCIYFEQKTQIIAQASIKFWIHKIQKTEEVHLKNESMGERLTRHLKCDSLLRKKFVKMLEGNQDAQEISEKQVTSVQKYVLVKFTLTDKMFFIFLSALKRKSH